MAGSQKKGKAKHLKLVFQILFFAALTVLAFYYILKEDPKKVFQTLSQARALPLSLAVVGHHRSRRLVFNDTDKIVQS